LIAKVKLAFRTHHLEKEVTKALLIGRTARVGLDSDEEAALKVGEGVEVEEEVVDLILGDDVVGLYLTLVVLARAEWIEGCQHGPATRRTSSGSED
jgi:hypothetical protein